MAVQSYKDLQVWQKAADLVEETYKLSKSLPKEEIYGLTSQLRRCAVSVPSNIAEGSSKRSTKEFIRFINISYRSLAEVETQLLIAGRLHYCQESEIMPMTDKIAKIGRMLNGLLRALTDRLSDPVTELRTPNSELLS